jgi:hypothetical protein
MIICPDQRGHIEGGNRRTHQKAGKGATCIRRSGLGKEGHREANTYRVVEKEIWSIYRDSKQKAAV